MRTKLGTRKVIETNAQQTKAVSLPRVWIDTMNVKTGDTLELEMLENGLLTIRPVKLGGKHE